MGKADPKGKLTGSSPHEDPLHLHLSQQKAKAAADVGFRGDVRGLLAILSSPTRAPTPSHYGMISLLLSFFQGKLEWTASSPSVRLMIVKAS